jgi:predicted dehydrogenase
MLKWGILGTGEVAFDVAFAINYVQNNKVVGVASRTAKNAEWFAGNLPDAKAYADYEALIQDPNVDIIYVATPNSTHSEMMRKCIAAKKHILCEKPFCLESKEGQEIKALANAANVFCMEALWTRFIPATKSVIKQLKNGKIGTLRFVKGSFGHIFSKKRCYSKELGGGVLFDLGMYLISLTYPILGSPDSYQFTPIIGKTGVDEQSNFTFSYKSGIIASFQCSFLNDLENTIEFYGENGILKLGPPFYRTSKISFEAQSSPNGEHKKEVRKNPYGYPGPMNQAPYYKERLKPILPSKTKVSSIPFKGNGYHYEIEEVYNCIQKGWIESEILPLDHSIKVVDIMNKLYKSEPVI